MLTKKTGILFACIVLTVFLGVPQVSADTEANKAIVSRLFDEVFNQGNMGVIDEIVAPKFLHFTAGQVDAEGSESYKELVGVFRTAFPDLNVAVEDVVAKGDMVTVRLTYTGTHKGNLRDISPTDAEVIFTGISTFKISDGKIFEGKTEYDVLGVMLQLGVFELTPDWPPGSRQAREDFMWTAPSDVTGEPGDPETNKAIVLRMYEVTNLANVDVMDEVVATNVVNHDPIWYTITEFDVYKEWMAGWAADLTSHETVDLIFAEGDKVVTHWTYTWMDASQGKRLGVSGADIWRLADGKIVERWSSKDFFTVLQEPTEDYSNVFFMSLEPGLNMVSLPLKPIAAYTARSFAEEIGAIVVIKYDEEAGKFVGFDLNAPGEGFPIEGGEGYIVNVPAGGVFTFTGAAWTNDPPVEAAPPVAQTDSAWAFVVSGSLYDGEAMSARDGAYTVIVKNLQTGETYTEEADSTGYFAAAYADLTRKAVVKAGDKVEIVVTDSSGEIASGPIIREITLEAIRDAVVNVRLRLGDIIPAKSLLLQNYPNPFNPETWIPYHLRDAAPVSIKIYNASGQLVRVLDMGHKDAGIYASRSRAAYWDGKNEAGEEVASGIYFYTITAGDFSATRKMIVKK